MELFSLVGKISIDDTGASGVLDKIKSKASSLASGLQSAGSKISDFGGKLTKTVSVAGAAIAGFAAKAAINFEDQMANINTLLDDSSHLKGYQDAIMNLSNKTGIALSTVSDGMYQTISSIGDGGEATQRMFEIMGKSAKAGGAEVADSVALISAGMKGYNQVNEETAQKISDLGFQTAKLGVTTFPELAKSMQPLFPLSSSLGLSYEELFGVMATGTGVTGNTAEVTTQFKAVLSNLMSPTTAMTDLIAKYGYQNAQAMLQSEGLSGVLKIVQAETGGQADKMAELFSSTEAVTLMTALTGAQFDNFIYKLGEMQNATGTTDAAYEKLNTNGDKLRVTWNQVKNTMTELGGTIIETFGPTVISLCEKVQQACAWFSSLDSGTQKTIVTIGGIAIAAGPVISTVGSIVSGVGSVISIGSKLIGGVGGVIGVLGKLSSVGGVVISGITSAATFIGGTLIPAIGAIGAPVLVVVGVIAAVTAAGVALYKNWDSIKEFAGKCWDGITGAVSAAKDKICGFFQNLGDKFHDAVEGMKEKATDWKDNVVEKAGELKDKAVNKIRELKDSAVEKFNNLKDSATSKVSELKDAAVSKFGELKDRVLERAASMTENGIKHFVKLNQDSRAAVEGLQDKVSGVFSELKDKSLDKINSFKDKAVSGFQNLASSAKGHVQGLAQDAISSFSNMGQTIGDKLSAIGNGIGNVFGGLKDKVSGIVDSVKAFFKFDWKLPEIKLPHFSMEGEFSWNPLSFPKIGVEWYAKGGVLTRPTAFALNPFTGRAMVGGEAGPEAIAPISTLQQYVRIAVAEKDDRVCQKLEAILQMLQRLLPDLVQRQLILDTGAVVGAFAPAMNTTLGEIAKQNERIK